MINVSSRTVFWVGKRRRGAIKIFCLFLRKEKYMDGHSLVVEWLELHAFTAEGPGSIPDRGTKIQQAARCSQKKKKKKKKKEPMEGRWTHSLTNIY